MRVYFETKNDAKLNRLDSLVTTWYLGLITVTLVVLRIFQ